MSTGTITIASTPCCGSIERSYDCLPSETSETGWTHNPGGDYAPGPEDFDGGQILEKLAWPGICPDCGKSILPWLNVFGHFENGLGNVQLILKADVHDYRDHRYRTQLVKALGWAGRGLYRNEDIDIECPECGGFAVEWPALDPNVFLCLKGHRGEDYFDGGQTSPD